MIRTHQPVRSKTAPRRLIATVAGVILLVAGCSTSGAKKLDASDLSKAMPTAQDLGAAFHRDKAGEADTNDDTKLQVSAKCKKLLNNEDDKGKVKAKRNFKDDREREVDVSATVSKETLASVNKTAKSCTKVPFTSGTTKGLITFKVTSSDGFGDDADVVDLVLTVTTPITLSIKGHGILAKRGDIGMSVVGFDGIDSQAKITPIDNAEVDKVARDLDQKIKDAQS